MDTNKLINYGTCGLVCLHVLCCGLPLLAAIAGVASPFAGIISPTATHILLGFAGVATIWSWVQYFRGCKCHKILLIISTVLFVAALTVHFVIPHITGVETCH